MQRIKLFIPLIVFAALAVFFLVVQKEIGRGQYNPENMPSALVGKPLPAFALPSLTGSGTISRSDVVGKVMLVNFWATWCPTCLYEHPYLDKLAAKGVVIVGVNYKDDKAKAQAWLQEKGNPYRWVIEDQAGSLGLDLGVTGAPETFVVDRKGIIRLRYQGALDATVWQQQFQPLMARLEAEGTSS